MWAQETMTQVKVGATAEEARLQRYDATKIAWLAACMVHLMTVGVKFSLFGRCELVGRCSIGGTPFAQGASARRTELFGISAHHEGNMANIQKQEFR